MAIVASAPCWLRTERPARRQGRTEERQRGSARGSESFETPGGLSQRETNRIFERKSDHALLHA